MKKIVVAFLTFVISKSGAQESKKDSIREPRYKIETGIVIPIGDLRTKFETAQQIGFWYRTKIEHNDRMDFGLSLHIPRNTNEFTFKGTDSIFRVKPQWAHGMVGIRTSKLYDFEILKQKTTLEWSSSIGYAFFIFDDLENRIHDIKNPMSETERRKQNQEDKEKNRVRYPNPYKKALSALYFGQGIVLNCGYFGVQCQYNYTPYNWFSKRIDSNFGNSSLTLGFFYAF